MASGTRGVQERQRFLDVDKEPNKLLTPLSIPDTGKKGIQSLRQCVMPIVNLDLVPNLLNAVAESLDVCKKPKDGLTQDQSAALYLYSLQHPFYEKFNGVLRNEDRTKAVPFFHYYELFMCTLNKLPPVKGSVWRGVTADISDRYKEDSIHIWQAASSCTQKVHVTDTFLDQEKHRTLFNIKCFNGRSIKNHSRYPNENETILPPGTCIKVISRLKLADKCYVVDCEEITLSPEELNNLLTDTTFASPTVAITVPILYLIWVDQNVNKSKENIATQKELRALFEDDFQTFDN
ncbi:unnamed protein product, partial [Rotaria sp. Silwood1]